ncbi:tyrosine-protein kinase receptor Tie-1-like [Diadema antillarum]|uniref:tyrosine-protein kinase receptor Tie-1-like n=1 Tax=Diadema antillarum TaxID=105358 RepID=UPI003A853CD5
MPVLKRFITKFLSRDGTFTRTVNAGERGIKILMTAIAQPDRARSPLRWRFNGTDALRPDKSSVLKIRRPVTQADEGVYEIFYRGERDTARGGLFRLIVRDCPAGKWGPPDCSGICDMCYNGGVCDDKSGRCICPNGFKGPNCLTICGEGREGGNRFGRDCEFRCSIETDEPNACRGFLFCLPDPFGCSCDRGFRGHDCSGKYGAGCSESCHCASGECDRFTGTCRGFTKECSDGWSGTNCQIPAVCPRGYFGQNCTDKCHCLDDKSCDRHTGACSNGQCAMHYTRYDGSMVCEACRGLAHGRDCNVVCRCEKSACDVETGMCRGSCLENWLPPHCGRGVTKLESNPRVNPGQPSNFTCHVTGSPPPDPESVHLSVFGARINEVRGITRRSAMTTGSDVAVVFDVEEVVQGGRYSCALVERSGTAVLEVEASTFDLPVITRTPSVTGIDQHDVKLQWEPWRAETDVGDPPVIGYGVFYQGEVDNAWWEAVNVTYGENLTATVAGLREDTVYRFAVAAVREGPGGTGEPGPTVDVTTLCADPDISQFQVAVSPNNPPRQLTISWQKPPQSAARCRSGFTNVTIHYIDTATNEERTEVVDFDATSSCTLTALGTYTEYSLFLTAANKDTTSSASELITARTAEEAPPAPDVVRVVDSSVTSLKLLLKAAQPLNLNGRIVAYQVEYRRIHPDPEPAGKHVTRKTTLSEIFYVINDLARNTTYSIQARLLNGAGSGPWSSPMVAKTRSSLHPSETNRGSSTNRHLHKSVLPASIGGAAAALLVAVIVGFLFYRSRKRKPEGKPGAASKAKGKTNKK